MPVDKVRYSRHADHVPPRSPFSKDIMVQNIDSILARGERIELLVDKTDTMAGQAHAFRRGARGACCARRVAQDEALTDACSPATQASDGRCGGRIPGSPRSPAWSVWCVARRTNGVAPAGLTRIIFTSAPRLPLCCSVLRRRPAVVPWLVMPPLSPSTARLPLYLGFRLVIVRDDNMRQTRLVALVTARTATRSDRRRTELGW